MSNSAIIQSILGTTPELSIIRYAKEMILHIEQQTESNECKIYPPHLEITFTLLLRHVQLINNLKSISGTTPELSIIRYAKEMILHIELQSESNEGQIYPPLLEITYDQATSEDMAVNQTVRVSWVRVHKFHSKPV